MKKADAIALNEQMLIPDLLRAAPQVRPVLDRYGLRGCGGPLGPMESLHFFAQAHDVPLGQLMDDLRMALGTDRPVAAPATAAATHEETLADTIYRPFFKGGIAVVLTLGGLWGVWLLLRIALFGSFMAVGVHEVNAHGHAQIFGWVGLFVMGFAYQAFPRFKHTSLAYPRLAHATLWMMLAGIIAHSLLEPFVGTAPWAGLVALAGSAVEIVAISLFIWLIMTTFKRSDKPLAFYDYYVLCALGWFIVQAIYETIYFSATLHATSFQTLVPLVATWQGSLRDIQIHGFAMLMILGVSQRLFHHFYGLPAPKPRRSLICLSLLNMAIVGEVAGLIMMRLAGHAWAALWYGSVLMLTGVTAALVAGWHIFSRPAETDRSLKFLRAAYVWLFLSLAMLVAVPAWQFGVLRVLAPESMAAQLGFSHAYYGAIRHAITVGFISLMIVGVASKVVPTLAGLDVHALPALWLPFILLNAGCAWRVGGQALTDIFNTAFPVTGVSGLLEITGLAIWGTHLWRIMSASAKATQPVTSDNDAVLGRHILAGHRVGAVLTRHPELLETFLRFGFTPLANPVLRATLARGITIASACRMHGIDEQCLLADLNEQLDTHGPDDHKGGTGAEAFG